MPYAANDVIRPELALIVHGAVLSAALAIVVMYRGHAKYVMDMNTQCKEIAQRIRFRICDDLRGCLRPVFEGRESLRISDLLNCNGDPWELEPTHPEGTEAYRNAIAAFVRTNTDAINDYRRVKWWTSARKYWTDRTFWLALLMIVWESLAFISTAIANLVFAAPFENAVYWVSFVPAGVAIILFCLAQAVAMLASSRVAMIADDYE